MLLGLLVALAVLGSSAVAVALPVLGEDLGIDFAGRAWVLAAFSLAFSVSTACFGRVADLVGLRLPLRVGILLFAIGSLAAALAPTYPILLAGRLLQGLGAGAVPVLAAGVIAALFDDEHRGPAFGALTSVVAIVSGAGPLVGGVVTQLFGWRWVLALPIVQLVLMEPVARLTPAGRSGEGTTLDLRGAGLMAVLVTGVVLVLQSPATGAGPAVLAAAAVTAAAAAALLTRHVVRSPEGFLPLALVRNRRYVLTAVTGPLLLAPYFALVLGVPQILAGEWGWSALQIGLALLPAAALGAVTSRVVGGSAAAAGRERQAALLAAGSAAGLLLAAAGAPRPVLLVAGLGLTACGFAGGQVALLESVTEHAEPAIRGVAIGIFNLLYFTGAGIGTAAVGGLAGILSLPGAVAALAVLPALGVVTALAAARAPATATTAPR